MKNLAKNVSIYRVKANLTSKQLSRLIYMSEDFIDKLENLKLKHLPSVYTIYKISVVLSIMVDDLLDENSI